MARKKQQLDRIRCAWCSKLFRPKRTWQKYCCKAHSEAARRDRKRVENLDAWATRLIAQTYLGIMVRKIHERAKNRTSAL
jgi:uncharacterized C2H2 Zn-finger protein